MSAIPTSRELFRRIWSLSWPMVVYNLLEMTVGFVDLLMVRPFGPEATAAIGISRQITFLIEGAVIAIATGVITLVSQARFLQHESVSIVVSMGYGDAGVVWHQAPGVRRAPSLLVGLTDFLNRRGDCHAGGAEDGAAGPLGFAAEQEAFALVLDLDVLQGL